MKSLLLMGGFLGFGIGLLLSWAEESPWPSCLWHASLAAYLTSLLMRWWGGAWRKSLEASLRERQAAAAAASIIPSTLPKLSKS